MPRLILLTAVFFFANWGSFAQKKDPGQLVSPIISQVLKFSENNGQWPENVLFKSTLDGGSIFIEKNCMTFSFYDKKKLRDIHHSGMAKGIYKNSDIKGHAYRVLFEGCNKDVRIEKLQPGQDYENFFLGSDKNKWKGNVRNYHQVWIRNLYNGIDYEALTAANGIKYNFYLKPGAKTEDIKIKYEGIDKMKLKEGSLFLKLEIGEVKEQKPFAYQMIDGKVKIVSCRYKLNDNVLNFDFPDGYDKNYELIIDPVLIFAAQSGSLADNFGMTATYDGLGNLFAGGTVFDNGYPVTLGAISSVFTGNAGGGITDLVITKYNALGNALIYSTYLGGSQAEIVTSMITDSIGNLYLYGATSSLDFPIPNGGYDNSFNGGNFLSFQFNGTTFNNGTDIFVEKFNSTGTAILGGTFIGGSNNDGVNYNNFAPATHTVFPCFAPGGFVLANEFPSDSLQYNYGDQYRGEIQLDKLGSVYVASSTKSSNFPVVGAFQNTLNGKQDAVVFKLNNGLTSLIWSTYLGGSGNDAGYSLIVDDTLQTYVTGGTYSSNFPVVAGCYQTAAGGGKADGYLAKISAAGNQILKATYIGTANYDQSYFVQSDRIGRIYVFGQSLGNMPVSPGTYSNAGSHQFLMRFNNQLTNSNVLSTVVGSGQASIDISPSAFSVDKCSGAISLSGWGGNFVNCSSLSGMPVTLGAFQTNVPNGHDFYLMVLHPNFSGLKYGTYFGGNLSDEHVDGGTSRINNKGVLYQSVCAGCGGNDDFPVTPGAWPGTPGDPNHAANCNNGVFKFDYEPKIKATIVTNTIAGCVPLTITFTNLSSPGLIYLWNLGGGPTNTTNVVNPTKTFTATGTYTVSLIAIENQYCFSSDTSYLVIQVYPNPTTNFSVTSSQCSNTIALTHTTTGNLGPTPYSWNFGNGSPTTNVSSPSYTYPTNGVFNITLTVTDINGCKDVKTNTVSVFGFTPSVLSATICAGSSTIMTSAGGTSYTWTPASFLSNSLSANPVANPTSNIVYTVIVNNNSPGYICSKTLTAQVQVNPVPSAAFTFSSSLCSNTVITNNISSGTFTNNSYVWNFGDATGTVSAISPGHTYLNNGTFTISLSVFDVNGCSSVKIATISVFNFLPGVVSSATICDGQKKPLFAQGGTQYTWTPSNSLNNNLIASPLANPRSTTVYTVNVLNNSQGYPCAQTLTTEVLVNPTPTTAFNYTANPCGGDVNFFDKSTDEISSWSWTLSPTYTTSNQNPVFFYSGGGTYVVSLVTANQFGCRDRVDTTINVIPPPPLSVNATAQVCKGKSAQLSASGGIAYSWTPPDRLDFPTLNNPMASPLITTQYSVLITTPLIIDGKPCKFQLTTEVIVTELSTKPISASANPVMVVTGNSSSLTYVGDPGALVTWYPLNSTSPVTGYSVLAYPDKPTTYTVVVGKGPCSETLTVHVDAYSEGCLDKDAFVPNTFTPNNDGQNDILYVRGIKVDDLYFAVYNRWGEIVFETKDKTKGWDGKYKGKDSDAGVFGWYVRAKCVNGGEAFKKGNVTLIR